MAFPRPSTVAEAIERDARVLAAVEGGKKQVEVAAELGVTPARVCQIVRRARERREAQNSERYEALSAERARLYAASAVPA